MKTVLYILDRVKIVSIIVGVFHSYNVSERFCISNGTDNAYFFFLLSSMIIIHDGFVVDRAWIEYSDNVNSSEYPF